MRFCGYEVDGSDQDSFTVGRDHVPIVEVTVAPTPWSGGVPGIGSLSFLQKETYRHHGGHAEDSYPPTESGYASGGLLVLLGQALANDQPLATVLTVASWVLWAVFLAEFALRAWLARHTAREFWKRNWWQLIFLAVPFLRFARAATALRAARGTGVVAAAVRGSRSAGRLLTDRLAWLAVVTLSLILAAGQLLVPTGSYRMYGKALHDVTLATISGEPLTATDTFAQVLELVLAAYSAVVFATLAGALGAFFLSRQRADNSQDTSDS